MVTKNVDKNVDCKNMKKEEIVIIGDSIIKYLPSGQVTLSQR